MCLSFKQKPLGPKSNFTLFILLGTLFAILLFLVVFSSKPCGAATPSQNTYLYLPKLNFTVIFDNETYTVREDIPNYKTKLALDEEGQRLFVYALADLRGRINNTTGVEEPVGTMALHVPLIMIYYLNNNTFSKPMRFSYGFYRGFYYVGNNTLVGANDDSYIIFNLEKNTSIERSKFPPGLDDDVALPNIAPDYSAVDTLRGRIYYQLCFVKNNTFWLALYDIYNDTFNYFFIPDNSYKTIYNSFLSTTMDVKNNLLFFYYTRKITVYDITNNSWYEIPTGANVCALVRYIDDATSTAYLFGESQIIIAIDLKNKTYSVAYDGNSDSAYVFDNDAYRIVADTQNKTIYFFKDSFNGMYSSLPLQVLVSFDTETGTSTYIDELPLNYSGDIILDSFYGKLYYQVMGPTCISPDKIGIFNLTRNNYTIALNSSAQNTEPQNANETKNFTASLNVTNNGFPVASSYVRFNVTNLSPGWDYDIIYETLKSIVATPPYGYQVIYKNISVKNQEFIMELNKTIILSITPSENSTYTEKTITLTAKFSKNQSISASTNFTIRVNPIHKVRVDNYTINKTAKPGEDVNLSVLIKNSGGFQENASVSFENNTFNMTNRTFALNLDEEKLINNTIQVPLIIDLGEYNTTATISYGDSNNISTIDVIFHIVVSASRIVVQSSVDCIQSVVNTPKTNQLNISNDGSELLNASIETSGAFSITPNQTQIPPHSSIGINLTFTPTSNTTYYGNITIYSNDPTKQIISIPVIGIGVGVPKISIPISTLYFSSPVNTTENKSILIANLGTGCLAIQTSITQPYTVEPSNIILDPNETGWLNITFAPEENKTYAQHLTIYSNDETTPVISIPLIGVGIGVPSISINKTPIYPISSIVNQTKNITIEIKNIGTGNLTVSNITTLSPFIVDVTNFTIQPNEIKEIGIVFIPTTNKTYYGNLTLHTNAPTNQTIVIPLVGIGIGIPKLETNLTALNFGAVKTNSTKNLSAEIRNTGTGILIISGWSTTAPFFADNASVNLRPNEVKIANITFAPTVNKTYISNLTLYTNDPNKPTANISLIGIGEVEENITGGVGLPPTKWFIPYVNFIAVINILIIVALIEILRKRR